ncbi:MAG: hypothetical protein SGARI_003492 [Bacillariaceae sp.]
MVFSDYHKKLLESIDIMVDVSSSSAGQMNLLLCYKFIQMCKLHGAWVDYRGYPPPRLHPSFQAFFRRAKKENRPDWQIKLCLQSGIELVTSAGYDPEIARICELRRKRRLETLCLTGSVSGDFSGSTTLPQVHATPAFWLGFLAYCLFYCLEMDHWRKEHGMEEAHIASPEAFRDFRSNLDQDDSDAKLSIDEIIGCFPILGRDSKVSVLELLLWSCPNSRWYPLGANAKKGARTTVGVVVAVINLFLEFIKIPPYKLQTYKQGLDAGKRLMPFRNQINQPPHLYTEASKYGWRDPVHTNEKVKQALRIVRKSEWLKLKFPRFTRAQFESMTFDELMHKYRTFFREAFPDDILLIHHHRAKWVTIFAALKDFEHDEALWKAKYRELEFDVFTN